MSDLGDGRDLSLGEDGVQHHVGEGAAVHQLHHHLEAEVLQEEVHVVDQVGVGQLPHHHDLHQQVVLPLVVRYVNSFDCVLK